MQLATIASTGHRVSSILSMFSKVSYRAEVSGLLPSLVMA
jgi:hypothetical protein